MSYKIIYDSIIRCRSKLITFIHDFKSEQFINFILEDLKSDYKIVKTLNLDSYEVEDNSVIVIYPLRLLDYKISQSITLDPDIRIKLRREVDSEIKNLLSKIYDKNIIVISLTDYRFTSNTVVFGHEVYSSDTVLLLKNNELSFIKKRTVGYETDKFNISQLLRNVKIKIINKSND